ncbi:MAG: M56 family metallopeptidase [Pseudomonadota bacterium]
MISWGIQAVFEVSFVIALILGLRPLVRMALGAQAAYLLWALIPVVIFVPELPTLPYQPDFGALTGWSNYAELNNISALNTSTATFPLLTAWLSGFIVWSIWKVASYRKLRTYLAQSSTHLGDPAVLRRLPEGLHSFKGELYSTNSPNAPFVTGYTNPKIYLPEDFKERFSETQQTWVLRHEIAHIDRGDLWVLLLAETIRAVFWFNPLVHIALRALRKDQEFACDQYLLGDASREQRIEYGEALLVSQTGTTQHDGITFFKTHLERYKMIAKHRHSLPKTLFGYALTAVIATVVLTSSPNVQANALDDKPITLNFKQIDANKLISIVSAYLEISFDGVDQLSDIKVDVAVKNVSARQALSHVLSCHGYGITELSDAKVKIHPVSQPNTLSTCP